MDNLPIVGGRLCLIWFAPIYLLSIYLPPICVKWENLFAQTSPTLAVKKATGCQNSSVITPEKIGLGSKGEKLGRDNPWKSLRRQQWVRGKVKP